MFPENFNTKALRNKINDATYLFQAFETSLFLLKWFPSSASIETSVLQRKQKSNRRKRILIFYIPVNSKETLHYHNILEKIIPNPQESSD